MISVPCATQKNKQRTNNVGLKTRGLKHVARYTTGEPLHTLKYNAVPLNKNQSSSGEAVKISQFCNDVGNKSKTGPEGNRPPNPKTPPERVKHFRGCHPAYYIAAGIDPLSLGQKQYGGTHCVLPSVKKKSRMTNAFRVPVFCHRVPFCDFSPRHIHVYTHTHIPERFGLVVLALCHLGHLLIAIGSGI